MRLRFIILFRINEKLIPDGFTGWINTKSNYLNFQFLAKSYNYGFDMEWRCTTKNASILDNQVIDQTLLIFSSFQNLDPTMKTFTEGGFQIKGLFNTYKGFKRRLYH